MRRLILNSIILLAFGSKAQNWNAFNKTYRYNYIYDHNQLITNVLFTDSIKQSGADTIYYMNRIGVECTGTCPTVTSAITTTETVIVPNMPQFLQRTIVKKADATVLLQDTATWLIKPNCILNEIWIFDAINSKTAECVSVSTVSIFNTIDSLKTIIVDGTDSLLISKEFGIVQFPNVYGKNKYFRLVGIEKANSYDLYSLFGIKVPNAWDFYNFDIGDKFYSEKFDQFSGGMGGQGAYFYYEVREEVVESKLIQQGASIRILYGVKQKMQKQPYLTAPMQFSDNSAIISYTPSIKSIENVMYPGQMVYCAAGTLTSSNLPYFNIVKFGLDNNSRFYKYAGRNCSTFTNVAMPNYSEEEQYVVNGNLFYPVNTFYNSTSYVYGVGLGQIAYLLNFFPYIHRVCLLGAYKNGSLYLGADTYVGQKENSIERTRISVYPNPTKGNLMMEFSGVNIDEIRLNNLFGQTIKSDNNFHDNKVKFDLKDQNSGIYFLQIYSEGKLIDVRKVIKD